MRPSLAARKKGGTLDTDRIEHLIARVALGDRSAFSELYDATSAKLFGVTLRILRDRGEAEDVLQEVFLRVWRRADRYGANGYSPMTWLITIARNASIDRIRAKKVAGRESGDGLDAAEQLADSRPSPEAEAVAASERVRLDRCLDELKNEKAGAVRGAYLDGDSYQDLADRYGVPLNTMRTWLRRSLLKLRECLSK